MLKLILKHKSKIKDDIIDKLEESDFRDYDTDASEDLYDWAIHNIVPALKLILNEEVRIQVAENGEIVINTYDPSKVKDAIIAIYNKFPKSRSAIKKIYDGVVTNDTILLVDVEDLETEDFMNWIYKSVLPKVQKYLNTLNVNYNIIYDQGKLVIKFEHDLDNIDEVDDNLVDVFQEMQDVRNVSMEAESVASDETIQEESQEDNEESESIDGEEGTKSDEVEDDNQGRSKVKDDIEDIFIEKPAEIPLDYETFLREVIIPAVQHKIDTSDYDTDITVDLYDNMIVINTALDKESEDIPTDKDVEDKEEDDEVDFENADKDVEDVNGDAMDDDSSVIDAVNDGLKHTKDFYKEVKSKISDSFRQNYQSIYFTFTANNKLVKKYRL